MALSSRLLARSSTPTSLLKGKTSAGSYFNALTDCATQVTAGVSDLSVAISYYSTFKTTIASDKNGRIVGIIQRSVTTNKNSGQSTQVLQPLASYG